MVEGCMNVDYVAISGASATDPTPRITVEGAIVVRRDDIDRRTAKSHESSKREPSSYDCP
jgi:hypothetical protein